MARETDISRREFLKKAAIVGGALLAGGGIVQGMRWLGDVGGNRLTRVWRLNPAFRVYNLNPQCISLYTHLPDGNELNHRFEGLEADIFRLLEMEEHLINHLPQLATRHGLDEESCGNRIGALLHEYRRAQLVYTGEKMLVKVVEVDAVGKPI